MKRWRWLRWIFFSLPTISFAKSFEGGLNRRGGKSGKRKEADCHGCLFGECQPLPPSFFFLVIFFSLAFLLLSYFISIFGPASFLVYACIHAWMKKLFTFFPPPYTSSTAYRILILYIFYYLTTRVFFQVGNYTLRFHIGASFEYIKIVKNRRQYAFDVNAWCRKESVMESVSWLGSLAIEKRRKHTSHYTIEESWIAFCLGKPCAITLAQLFISPYMKYCIRVCCNGSYNILCR